MEIKKGVAVKTADGDKVGTVDRIVVDPANHNEVTHIVVEKGFLLTEARVIPAEALAVTDGGEMLLKGSIENPDAFPKFEQTDYVSPERTYYPTPWGTWEVAPLFYYPPIGDRDHTYSPASVDNPAIEHSSRNISDDNVVISEGMRVTTSDGEHAGNVEKIYTDKDGQMTHILISKGIIFDKESLIPVGWIRWMNEEDIRLSVTIEIVKNLPEYKEHQEA